MKETLTRYETTCVFRALQVGLGTPGTHPLTQGEYDAALEGGKKIAQFIFSDVVTITDELFDTIKAKLDEEFGE